LFNTQNKSTKEFVSQDTGLHLTLHQTNGRHTWEDFFADDNDILISLLPLDVAEDIPSFFGKFDPGAGLLQQILVLPDTVTPDGRHVHAKIGTATTNEQFREWSARGRAWTIPLNVIMSEITFGGSVSQMCHGAGLRNPTLSDLVREVEFVDAHGELRTVSDPELLKTAAGSFGSFGIVTAYTLRLDKMTYANMRPHHAPVELAIPPPLEYILEARRGNPQFRYIKELIAPHSQETLDAAYKEFVRQAENDYYAEWFWFPGQRDIWVNTWDNDGLESLSRNIPSDFEAFLEWLEEWISEEVCNWAVFQLLPGESQAKILGFLTLLQMPNIKAGDASRTFTPLRWPLTWVSDDGIDQRSAFPTGNSKFTSLQYALGNRNPSSTFEGGKTSKSPSASNRSCTHSFQTNAQEALVARKVFASRDLTRCPQTRNHPRHSRRNRRIQGHAGLEHGAKGLVGWYFGDARSTLDRSSCAGNACHGGEQHCHGASARTYPWKLLHRSPDDT
jgi:hypothetical protein